MNITRVKIQRKVNLMTHLNNFQLKGHKHLIRLIEKELARCNFKPIIEYLYMKFIVNKNIKFKIIQFYNSCNATFSFTYKKKDY